MLIRLGFEITHRFPEPTPMLLTLNVHDSRRADIAIAKELQTDPPVPMQQYHDGFGNVCTRLVSPAGLFTVSSDVVVRDTGWTDAVVPGAQQVPVYQLPDETLVYLLGSRYCETDKLVEKAWDLFGAHAYRLGPRAGDLRLRAQPHPVRLSNSPTRPRARRWRWNRAAGFAGTSRIRR